MPRPVPVSDEEKSLKKTKRLTFLLLLTALVCLSAACADRSDPLPTQSQMPQSSSAASGSETGESSAANSGSAADDLAEAGFRLLEEETLGQLRYGQSVDEVTTLLGEPTSRTEPEIWAADGCSHESWTYEGVELQFADGLLQRITVTAPFAQTTAAGIGIGAAVEEVQKAYAGLIDETTANEGTIVAGTVYGGLIFTIEHARVTAITLGVSAE